MPIADFITTSHTFLSISGYLFIIKKTYEKYSNLSKVVVTDFSWALINASLEIFNNMSILAYLKALYDAILSGKTDYQFLPVFVDLC